MLLENLKIALNAIRANKMRSVLTVLGVMIGVAAVIAVVSIVQGFQHKISNDLNQIGGGFIEVFPQGDRRNPFKTPELTATLLASIYSLMQFLFVPVWGRVSDRMRGPDVV